MCLTTLVTQQAPDFTAEAVMPDNTFGNITLSSYKGKYVILLFYPLDFTFVCPSEILAFNKKIEAFKSKNCEVIGISVDSKLKKAQELGIKTITEAEFKQLLG